MRRAGRARFLLGSIAGIQFFCSQQCDPLSAQQVGGLICQEVECQELDRSTLACGSKERVGWFVLLSKVYCISNALTGSFHGFSYR